MALLVSTESSEEGLKVEKKETKGLAPKEDGGKPDLHEVEAEDDEDEQIIARVAKSITRQTGYASNRAVPTIMGRYSNAE